MIFKLKNSPYTSSISFILGLNCRYNIILQKAVRESLTSHFCIWKIIFLLALLGRFRPFLLLFWAFQSALDFKFAASLVMNN